MEDVALCNQYGGAELRQARYVREPAAKWRDWVMEDAAQIELHLNSHMSCSVPRKLLVDVVVPTYRLELDYLERICSLHVPSDMQTTFILVVDNPDLLLTMMPPLESTGFAREENVLRAAQMLENHLTKVVSSINEIRSYNIRVRCNLFNEGASASRNRGLDESSAEYVLFLDDDVRPEYNLLTQYSRHLLVVRNDSTICGLVGMVQFPRRPLLPLKHAAVLMSYLTFMFEIANNASYEEPAWGVTANLLVLRTELPFDTDYAKTGGGEDVDFCLRMKMEKESNRRLLSSPNAVVHHEFWKGSILNLASHFFWWASGDSALFTRFPQHCYRSWPNAVEMVFTIVGIPWLSCMGLSATSLTNLAGLVLSFVAADVGVTQINIGIAASCWSTNDSSGSTWCLICWQMFMSSFWKAVVFLDTYAVLSYISIGQNVSTGIVDGYHKARRTFAEPNFTSLFSFLR